MQILSDDQILTIADGGHFMPHTERVLEESQKEKKISEKRSMGCTCSDHVPSAYCPATYIIPEKASVRKKGSWTSTAKNAPVQVSYTMLSTAGPYACT